VDTSHFLAYSSTAMGIPCLGSPIFVVQGPNCQPENVHKLRARGFQKSPRLHLWLRFGPRCWRCPSWQVARRNYPELTRNANLQQRLRISCRHKRPPARIEEVASTATGKLVEGSPAGSAFKVGRAGQAPPAGQAAVAQPNVPAALSSRAADPPAYTAVSHHRPSRGKYPQSAGFRPPIRHGNPPGACPGDFPPAAGPTPGAMAVFDPMPGSPDCAGGPRVASARRPVSLAIPGPNPPIVGAPRADAGTREPLDRRQHGFPARDPAAANGKGKLYNKRRGPQKNFPPSSAASPGPSKRAAPFTTCFFFAPGSILATGPPKLSFDLSGIATASARTRRWLEQKTMR